MISLSDKLFDWQCCQPSWAFELCMFSGSCCWFTSLTVGVGGAVAVSGGSVKADACVCFSLVEVISSNSNNLGSHN